MDGSLDGTAQLAQQAAHGWSKDDEASDREDRYQGDNQTVFDQALRPLACVGKHLFPKSPLRLVCLQDAISARRAKGPRVLVGLDEGHAARSTPARPAELGCESALRTGAATLCNGAGRITATTVVCEVDYAELNVLECLVADIADEFGVCASIREASGAYAVRFSA